MASLLEPPSGHLAGDQAPATRRADPRVTGHEPAPWWPLPSPNGGGPAFGLHAAKKKKTTPPKTKPIITTYTAHNRCKTWRNKEVRTQSQLRSQPQPPVYSPPQETNKFIPLATSKHSRAARRATSPGIDTDKSLKNVKPPPSDTTKKPDVLAAHHSSGITKKKRKVILSTKARKRQEKSMDRAEAVMDRTSTKVEKSKGSFRVIQSRKKTWDEVNREALGLPEPVVVPGKKAKASKKQAEDEFVAEFYAAKEGDEVMKGAEEEGGVVESGPVGAAAVPESGAGEGEVEGEWEDEVL